MYQLFKAKKNIKFKGMQKPGMYIQALDMATVWQACLFSSI